MDFETFKVQFTENVRSTLYENGNEGIGLIKKKHQGLGKPSVILVKNLILREEETNG